MASGNGSLPRASGSHIIDPMQSLKVAVVLVVTILLVGACGESASEPAPTPTPSPMPTPTPMPTPVSAVLAAPSAPPGEILLASFVAMDAVGSFHFEMEAGVTAPDVGITTQIPLSLTGDFRAPDRMRAAATVSLGLFTVLSDIVIIGDTIYATDPQTGEWEVTSQPELLLFNPLDFVGSGAAGLGNFSELTLLGAEILLGVQVYHLSGRVPAESFGQLEGEAVAELWIAVEDSLVHQIRFEGQFPLDTIGAALGAGQLSGTAELEMTLRFSDFGKPVLVEPPELPAGQEVLPGQAAPEGPGQRVPDQGREHVAAGAPHPPYNSVPATSGWHYSGPGLAPAPWGVYDEVLPDEVLVHNLEHGGIGVHYDCPDGCPDLVATLSNLVNRAVGGGLKIIMSPYPGMETTIALTAWNYLDKFNELDLQRALEFIDAHHASPNAPEPLVP